LPARRFPPPLGDRTRRGLRPPWSVEELEACFIVKDDAGQKLAFIYYEDEPQCQATGVRRLNLDRHD
jgi:hypothetical protein